MRATLTLTRPPRMTLQADTAADLMHVSPVSVPQDALLSEAVRLLTERGVSAAPVIDAAGRPVGVVSQSDVVAHDNNRRTYLRAAPEYYARADLRAALGEDAAGFQVEAVDPTRVCDVMTPVVFSVGPETPARVVVEEMLELHVHRLFVIDAGGVLTGVISMTDVLRRLAV